MPPVGPWTPGERGQAWAVHGFTALGIVASMLALRDVLTGHPDYAILWLLLTLLIDGVDGPIARALRVSERVPRIDGYTLDLIIDYVACVIVPACFMYEFHVVPQQQLRHRSCCACMVFTSAIWFARRDMMTDDFFFRGFPAAWNMVAPVHVPARCAHRRRRDHHAHPVRRVADESAVPAHHAGAGSGGSRRSSRTVVWVGGMVLGTFLYPGHPYIVRPLLYAGSAYFLLLAVVKGAAQPQAPAGYRDGALMAFPSDGFPEIGRAGGRRRADRRRALGVPPVPSEPQRSSAWTPRTPANSGCSW